MLYKSYLLESNLESLNKNITLFYGENLGLIDEFKKKIKFKKDFEFLIFDQEEIVKNENVILNEINNLSLFEKKKIFFINNVTDKILEIIKFVHHNDAKQKLYLFAGILEKKSKLREFFEKSKEHGCVPCYADNEASIKAIILNKLKGFQGLTTININTIIQNCSMDRSKLNNEVSKIFSYFDDKKIQEDKLGKLLNDTSNDNFNLLRDEALMGNKLKTNKLLSETIIENDKNIYYLNIINQRLNKLYDVLLNKNSTDMENSISKLRPPIFWKDKPAFLKQAKIWNLKKLKNTLSITYNLEIKMKSNSIIDKNVLIKKLLLDICTLASS